MQVHQIMNPNVVSIIMESSTADAAKLLKRYNIGSIPVTARDGSLRGIVTDRDIVTRCVAGECDPETTPVKDVMTRQVVTVPLDADVRQAANLMAAEQVRRLPVVKNSKLVGMLSLADIARTHSCDIEAGMALSEISMPKSRFE